MRPPVTKDVNIFIYLAYLILKSYPQYKIDRNIADNAQICTI